jgi:hypothetical protein
MAERLSAGTEKRRIGTGPALSRLKQLPSEEVAYDSLFLLMTYRSACFLAEDPLR